MTGRSIQRLSTICDELPPLLYKLGEDELSKKAAPGKWSKKEILGHLIDSAANNHHRFVRGQFEARPSIVYNADAWNAHSYYQRMDGRQLIAFWELYNRHLLALLSLIPAEKLTRTVNTGGAEAPSLAFLIDDYVAHLEHHLRQLVPY